MAFEPLLSNDTRTPRQAIFDELDTEREKQIDKWGLQQHSDEIWNLILVEEIGEISKAILDFNFNGGPEENIKKELIHAAAVIVQWLEGFDNEN